jgi:hypothetical protein
LRALIKALIPSDQGPHVTLPYSSYFPKAPPANAITLEA